MMARLQSQGFYAKNATVLEVVSEADTIVFDKTGTITLQEGNAAIQFENGALSPYEQQLVRALALQSNHPLSKVIAAYLPAGALPAVKNYSELKGAGSAATIDGHMVRMGNAAFVGEVEATANLQGSKVYVSINNELLGFFLISTVYRPGLEELVKELRLKYNLAVISGDNSSEEKNLRRIFGEDAELLFECSPSAKLEYISILQARQHKVIMIGDGLNDAGALQKSDLGIAVTDDINNFSPACDAILEGRQFASLKSLLDYCASEKTIIYGSFTLSILYNIIGLSYAVQGNLSPVIAAILMPVSSISIVLYTTVLSAVLAPKIKK
jgi:Cu+-exporting ATPase